MIDVAPGLLGFAVGLVTALITLLVRLRDPPPALVRINVEGRPVPAVLGDPVVVGSLVGVGAVALAGTAGWEQASIGEYGFAVALLVAAMGVAGRVDDLRGDEPDRGFRGHLKAALSGRLTGGAIKIAAGGLAGLAAGALVLVGIIDIILAGAAIALAANFFNLLDRAPGRAAKVWVVAMLPVLFLAPDRWLLASAGVVGAGLAVLPADVRARGMLGDAGVNPLGAVWGLGLAVATGTAGRAVTVAILLSLNLISERISFSDIIGRTAPLRAFDRLGRE